MMNLINLTPHDINLFSNEDVGQMITIPRSGNVARVNQIVSDPVIRPCVNGLTINICSIRYGDVIGLPDEVDNTFYIVSAMVKNASPNRTDLVSPGELLRDSNGNVIGCKNLFL